MTMTTDPRVRAYLDELDRALVDRPASDRGLVVDGVRQHIDDALASGVPVEQVLGDLGDPLAIAAESGDRVEPSRRPPSFLDRRGGSVLIVLLLAFGGLLVPVLGWIVGVVLLWSSRGWRTVDKVIGTVLTPALSVGVILGAHVISGLTRAADSRPCPGGTCVTVTSSTSLGPLFPESYDITWAVILLLPLIQLLVGIYLLVRFRPAR